MKIGSYIKEPDKNGCVYPTLEEFCSSHYGDEKIIVHDGVFDDYDDEKGEYVLDGNGNIVFIHGDFARPCSYLQKKYYMAAVEEWHIYPDGIHVRIVPHNAQEEETGGA